MTGNRAHFRRMQPLADDAGVRIDLDGILWYKGAKGSDRVGKV